MKDRLLRASWFVCLLAAAGLILTPDLQDVKYIQLGGVLELHPDTNSVTEPITGILWKHGPNKVAEWDQGFGPDVDYYGTYKKRTALNKETRRLIINNMNKEDSGVYSVEVNSRLQNKTYTVKVIKNVPNPLLAIKAPCTSNSTSCTLVCAGDITDSGPVTYRWKEDGGEWMVSDSNQLIIFNDEEGKKVQLIFCEMKNPVSVEQSDATANLFYKAPTEHPSDEENEEPEPVGRMVGGIIVALIIAVGLMLGVKYRDHIKEKLPESVRRRLPPRWFEPVAVDDPEAPTEHPSDEENEGIPLKPRSVPTSNLINSDSSHENEGIPLRTRSDPTSNVNNSDSSPETPAPVCQQQLKTNLWEKFKCMLEWITKGHKQLLNEIYTELYITGGGSGEVNLEHEVRQIETASRKTARREKTIQLNDILKPGPEEPFRTVMTKGVAGIGKTVLTQKYTLDWAEDKANKDIHLIFPLTFRELNLMMNKKKNYSLIELIHDFFGVTTNEEEICRSQVVFIIDGLDEWRHSLDFYNSEICTDVTKQTSVDVLLTNLIRGELLPSARIWITTRPAAASLIPEEYVDRVTEVRGFNDPQKEQYFMKKFSNKKQASTIYSHIQTSRSLHIMCHIPVFCLIIAAVIQDMLTTVKKLTLPNTLTEMYIHFMLVQSKQSKDKYHDRTTGAMLSLGKLAFHQLEKGNLIFYEADLKECGIDIKDAAVYSGVFTEMFKEVKGGWYKDQAFCFVHLSVQEFLAALHVFVSFINTGVNLLSEPQTTSMPTKPDMDHLYQSAADKALQSPNGHWDLFLRFLLGLSEEINQTLLKTLLGQEIQVYLSSGSLSEEEEEEGEEYTGSRSQTNKKASKYINKKTVKYIKKKIRENPSPERSINLFHCLNEMNDHSLEKEIQWYLSSGSLSTRKLSPAQWSALVFILLSSGKELDVFDLKKYQASEEALLGLLPVIKVSNRALYVITGYI